MKRSDSLLAISRRHFCSGVVAGVVVAGCGGSSDAPTADGSIGSNGVCPSTGALDVGAPSTFVMNTPVYFASGFLFVVRDANGLYALTARCPHQGFTTKVQGSDFVCPRHGSLFSFDGAVLTGPATMPLVHYAMCTLGNGNVGVFMSEIVADTQRLAA